MFPPTHAGPIGAFPSFPPTGKAHAGDCRRCPSPEAPPAGSSPFDLRWIAALSHPTRIAIVCALLEDDACAGRLASALDLPLAIVSHHLRFLADAERIAPRDADRYCLVDPVEAARMLAAFGLHDDRVRELDLPSHAPRQTVRRIIQKLRERREAQGLSRAALARRIPMNPSQLARIERGDADPRATVLIGIAHELGTSLEDIFALVER